MRTRLSRIMILAVLASSLMASIAHADNEAIVPFTIQESRVFFTDVVSYSPSAGVDVLYRIRAWVSGTEQRALLSKQALEYGIGWRSFEEATDSVVIKIREDFVTATLETTFPSTGDAQIELTLPFTNAKSAFVSCHRTGSEEWDLASPSELGLGAWMSVSGTVGGQPVSGHDPDCNTYGYDATGFGFIVGPKI